jgi:F-type H+-transporting ATPase subunit b
MPQFQFANFLPQMVWLAIFFAILYFGVVRLTLPKVGKVMTAREDQVSGDLNAAERAKGEADRIQSDYDTGVAAAHDQARAAVTAAQASATKALEAKLAQSNAAIEARTSAAAADLDTARTAALGQIEGVAAEAAAAIVEKLTGTRPAEDAATAAARAALA